MGKGGGGGGYSLSMRKLGRGGAQHRHVSVPMILLAQLKRILAKYSFS